MPPCRRTPVLGMNSSLSIRPTSTSAFGVPEVRNKLHPPNQLSHRHAFPKEATLTLENLHTSTTLHALPVIRLGRTGIDAVTRIAGFFVSAMGVSLVFTGVMGALGAYGVKVVL